ncbi:Ig-like domain-containing protein [Parahaliea mediterranea]|uniref:Ig-like domain-containing protein n=1 Tax=Parahaliea mediterranea TaxID=651086 RepID=UPI000E2F21C9|nr:Ig-like domain-containing protein [Parahaliea mediterranea]
MITRYASFFSRVSALLAIATLLTACGGGGGGGDGGGGFIPDNGSDDAYFLALGLEDADGNSTNTVTTSMPATLKARVTRKGPNGAVITDAVVSAEASIGVLDQATALTDAEGYAVFSLQAEGETGAGTITASVTNDDGTTTTQTLNYQVGAAGLRLGHFDSNGLFIENEIGVHPGSDLVYRGSAEVFVDIVDEAGQRATSPEVITLRSNCLATGKATLEPASPLETTTGSVSTTFTAIDCAGADEITATINSGQGQAFTTLNIGSPRANSLTFVSAEPNLIVLKGTGGGSSRQESSTVTFQVIDSSNNPLPNVDVNFSLSTAVGGLALSPSSDTSDDEGLVQVTLFSGDVSTVVRVIASVLAGDGSGQTLSTVSDILTVSTGLPDQNSISLSVEGSFVVENGFSMDGVQRCLTVRMADKFNNPVPNGTSAIFTTEYGTIDPSCVTGERNGERAASIPACGGATPPPEGQCDVLWTSGEPRVPTLPDAQDAIKTISNTRCPSLGGAYGPCPDDLGNVRGGRSTVLVTAVGEESFVDRNGNGVMDEEERDLFANLPEAFIDHNEDGFYTPALSGCPNPDSLQCLSGSEETFVDFNSDGSYNSNANPALYNGLLCPPEGDGVWCSRTLLNVYDDVVLILSAGDTFDGWQFQLARGSAVQQGTVEGSSYQVYISDLFNGRPPAGSTVTIASTDGRCQVSKDSFTVTNTTGVGAFGASFGVLTSSGDNDGSQTPQGCARESGTDTLRVTLSPANSGAAESVLYTCGWDNDAPQPAPADPNNPSC